MELPSLLHSLLLYLWGVSECR